MLILCKKKKKKKNADISQIIKILLIKGIMYETTYVCTYVPNFKLRA